ncbi:MAG: arginase family protein [Hyphomicrobiales bacterium]
MKHFTVIGAPASSIVAGPDVALAPEVLRNLGIAGALNADDAGDLDCDFGTAGSKSVSGLMAQSEVIEATAVIRRRIAQLVSKHTVPIVIGGCCAILPGAVAGACDATARQGEMGLAYIDGHTDLYDEETSPEGEAADMALATILGRGPGQWMNSLGRTPLIKAENAALIGFRDREECEADGTLLPEDFGPGIAIYDADSVRGEGAEIAAANVLAKLSQEPGRFWLHFDVDVLDDELFPATDYLMPNGLDWFEVTTLLRTFINAPSLVGMSLTCYNPHKDAGATCGLRLVDLFQAICKPRQAR